MPTLPTHHSYVWRDDEKIVGPATSVCSRNKICGALSQTHGYRIACLLHPKIMNMLARSGVNCCFLILWILVYVKNDSSRVSSLQTKHQLSLFTHCCRHEQLILDFTWRSAIFCFRSVSNCSCKHSNMNFLRIRDRFACSRFRSCIKHEV